MKEFFSKDPAKLVNEIKEELYGRLLRSRQLLAAYDMTNETLAGREPWLPYWRKRRDYVSREIVGHY